MNLINAIIGILKRIGTPQSGLAIICSTEYDMTTGIRPLVKIERSNIGKCTSIGTLCAIYDADIGKFCSIARECYIGGASHPLNHISTSSCFYIKRNYTGVCYSENNYNWKSPVKIGNDVWIGVRVIVKGGVTISDGAVIGAGSIVTKNVGPYEIWAGNPARFIRKRFDDEIIKRLLEIKWWNWDDKIIKENAVLFENPSKFFKHYAEK